MLCYLKTHYQDACLQCSFDYRLVMISMKVDIGSAHLKLYQLSLWLSEINSVPLLCW